MEQKAISSDLIRGHIDTIILHTLLDGDKYAQQIIDTVEEKSEGKYQLNQATLYSSLKRLEGNGCVKSYWFDSASGRRKYMKITERGIAFVDDNLSNWSFSRAIIDKLIDDKSSLQDAPEVQAVGNREASGVTQGVSSSPNNNNVLGCQNDSDEHIVLPEMKNDSVSSDNARATKPQYEGVSTAKHRTINTVSYIPVAKTERSENDFSPHNGEDEVKDINFRTILNGLIQAAETENQEAKASQKEELKPNATATYEEPQKQLKFNETISDENVINREIKNIGGKIDFSDIVADAEKDGFKIRVSYKNCSKPQGKVYSNKLHFFSSLAIFLFIITEYLILSSSVNASLLPANVAIILCVVLAFFPIMTGIIFARNTRKTMPNFVGGNKILTSGIIVFNLLLLCFALNFILGVDLYDKVNLVRYLLFPCVISLDILLFFIIEFFLSRISFFRVKIKK